MVSWADMATLMMCFFLLMLSFANFDEKKAQVSMGSIKSAFNRPFPFTSPSFVPATDKSDLLRKGKTKDKELEKAREKIQAALMRADISHAVTVELGPDGLTLVTLSPVLFEPGNAEVRPEAYGPLSTLAQILEEYQNDVRIEGHTSSATPEATSPFPTNWELSGARANAVLRYFIDKHNIAPPRMCYAGFGSERPKVSNDSPFGKKLNDRIEIKLITVAEGEDVGGHLKSLHKEIPNNTEMDRRAKPAAPQ
jgi:chemotaxis protein MotB